MKVLAPWQLSHPAVVGTWLAPCGTGVTPRNALPAALATWQLVHPVVIPAWFIFPEFAPIPLA